MAQVLTQQPAGSSGSGKKKGAAVVVLLIVVVAAVAIGVGVSMTSTGPGDDTNVPPPFNDQPQNTQPVDQAVITSATLDTSGNAVISFDWNTPGFTPRFKLYRAEAAFTTVAAATYIKTVLNSQIQDPSDKKITDTAPPAGTWFYGVIVEKPLGTGLGYLPSVMSNTMSVVIGSAGPEPPAVDPPAVDPEPPTGSTPITTPVILSASDVSSAGVFTITFQTSLTQLYVYVSTVYITEATYQTSYLKMIGVVQSTTTVFTQTHALTSAPTAAKYYIGLRAIDGAEISGLSNVMEMNVPSYVAPGGGVPVNLPTPPTMVYGQYETSSTIGIYWEGATSGVGMDISGYNVYFRITTPAIFDSMNTQYTLMPNFMIDIYAWLPNAAKDVQDRTVLIETIWEFKIKTVTLTGESIQPSPTLYMRFSTSKTIAFSDNGVDGWYGGWSAIF